MHHSAWLSYNSLCVKSFGRHVFMNMHFDGLVQDCSNSSALAVGLLQSCAKPSIYTFYTRPWHWNCTGWRYTPSSMTSNILNSLSSGHMELGQHWLRWWLVAWRYQAITWANVDLSSVRSLGIHLRSLSLDRCEEPINKTRLKIALLKSRSPRAQWVNICCQYGRPGVMFPLRICQVSLKTKWEWPLITCEYQGSLLLT